MKKIIPVFYTRGSKSSSRFGPPKVVGFVLLLFQSRLPTVLCRPSFKNATYLSYHLANDRTPEPSLTSSTPVLPRAFGYAYDKTFGFPWERSSEQEFAR
ncbi:hypothetical protein FRC03_007626 [Tulasnella sp. 419]|nr:hypothetical protein FRC03_007626 [Tulasnella sp. 419]